MPSKIKKRGENSYLLTVAAGYETNGKQKVYTKTIHATTDREVETQYGLFLAEIQKGQISTSGKMTLSQFYDYWVKNYEKGRHAPKTVAYNQGLFRRIDETLGHKRLNQIQPKHILEFYKNLGEAGIRSDKRKLDTLSPNTIRKYHILMHTLFEKATQWQLIAYNPVSKVEPPKPERHEKTIYDEETTGKFLILLDAETLNHKTMALLALSTGLRRGEMLGLQWKHINLETKTIKVEQATQYLSGKGIFVKGPKNEGSKRLITISANIVTLLKQHKAAQAAKRLKLGGTLKAGGKWQGAEDQENDFVFTTWNGKAAHPDSINKWLNKFVSNNNLPHLTPHSFRHMAATYLITAGVDLCTVAGKLGHSNSTTTQLVYSHLIKSAEEETANKLETFMQQATEKAKAKQKKQAN